MLRLLCRFPSMRSVECIGTRWNSTVVESHPFENTLQSVGRYEIFLPNSVYLYQFDDETRRLVKYEQLESSKIADWQHLPDGEINATNLINAFEKMVKYSKTNSVSLTDERFDQFIDRFIACMTKFTSNELLRALQLFANAELTKELMVQRNYVELHRAFDRQSTIQLAEMHANQFLFLCSIWLEIPWHTKTYFTVCISRLINRRFKTMKSTQLSLAAYYLSRLQRPVDEIREIEDYFNSNFDKMQIEDMAMMAWAFEKNAAKLQNVELRDKFFEYLTQYDFSKLRESVLHKISPFIARNASQSKAPDILKILESARHSIGSKSLNECIWITSLGTSIDLFDEVLLLHTLKMFSNDSTSLHELRMGAIENISRMLAHSENAELTELRTPVANRILDELKRRSHQFTSRLFYEKMVIIIRNLTMVDAYDIEFMENLFRSDYFEYMHTKNARHQLQLFEIDGYNRINLRQFYHGNYLPDKYLKNVKYLQDFIPDRAKRFHKRHQFCYAMEDIISRHFSHYQFAHVLPFCKNADIVVCLNIKSMEAVEIPKDTFENVNAVEASVLTDNNPDLVVLVFITGTMSQYIEKGEKKLPVLKKAYMKQKHQQLDIMGYVPITVEVSGWTKDSSKKLVEDVIVSHVNANLSRLGVGGRISSAE